MEIRRRKTHGRRGGWSEKKDASRLKRAGFGWESKVSCRAFDVLNSSQGGKKNETSRDHEKEKRPTEAISSAGTDKSSVLSMENYDDLHHSRAEQRMKGETNSNTCSLSINSYSQES